MAQRTKTPRRAGELTVVTTRLLLEDVEEMKRRTAATGVPWQVQLRALVHGVLFPNNVKVL